ncbi:MAG TPA: zinc ribbon domain-containing protein [Oscillospiraceae bacterium]|nr:zinc ribbon domain-containing protein [Oscillospiraceae bacterium]HPS35792.1 zinc ribbon domain-containing protein [Oscillospiraceae bacterium]
MSKTCEKCGAELSVRAAFCPVCGKTLLTAPVQEAVFPVKKGSAVLPKNPLSLWAAILTLIGAAGLLGYVLFDPLVNGASLSYYKTPSNALALLEALTLLVVSILLFIMRASGRDLKNPMLVWAAGALFGLPFAIYSFLQLLRQYDLLLAYYNLLIGVLPLLAALCAVLYAFKVIKRTPALIFLGLLLGFVLIAGTYMNIRILFSWMNAAPAVEFLTFVRLLLRVINSLFFPVGIFFSITASEIKKET